MSIAKNLKVAIASSLLITLVSCGGNDSKKRAPENSVNPFAQSYDWKISNGRGFGERALVELSLNGEVHTVINECHTKGIYKIDRSALPHTISMMNFVNPQGAETADIKVFDLGANCDIAPVHPDVSQTVRLNVNKDGAVAEVSIEI